MQRSMEMISALLLASRTLQPSLDLGRHLAYTCTLSLNQTVHNAKSLFDIDATAEAFIDLSYAHKIHAPLTALLFITLLLSFDLVIS